MATPTDRFAAWYVQVDGAADLDIRDLLEAFNLGVTPEEMNAR